MSANLLRDQEPNESAHSFFMRMAVGKLQIAEAASGTFSALTHATQAVAYATLAQSVKER